MTRTYVGPFKNPTENMFIKQVGEKYEIWVHGEDQDDNQAHDRPHSNRDLVFEEYEEAIEYLDGLHEHFEEDYDRYLDEHHDDIRRQEEYENYRNEY